MPPPTPCYSWGNYLNNSLAKEDLDGGHLDSATPSVKALAPDHLTRYVSSYINSPDFFVFAPVWDYNNRDRHNKYFWVARVMKVAGYRVLLRWLGSEDHRNDFWASVFYEDIRGLSMMAERATARWLQATSLERTYSFFDRVYRPQTNGNVTNEIICPPNYLYPELANNNGFTIFSKATDEIRTVGDSFIQQKKKKTTNKYKLGDRVELLDNLLSTRMRPARVSKICGRRICVEVRPEECEDFEPGDRQYGYDGNFWLDQDSHLIFPVGFCIMNGYTLSATQNYLRHVQKISDDILSGNLPKYASFDAQPQCMEQYGLNDTSEWEVGMRLELMDPLGASIQFLRVATVMKKFNDGYLLIGLDGPDIEEDVLPLHYTSPLLFPVGYAESHSIPLRGPDDVKRFQWKTYLKKKNAKGVPSHLFRPDPPKERTELFKIGAKLEAVDLCEKQLICVATVLGITGRVLTIGFDGWGDYYNQLFDIDSKDLLPLGWCDIYGYKLQPPITPKIQ